jgi:hypothetical protein
MTDRNRRLWLVAAVVIGCIVSAVQILRDIRLPVRWQVGVAARVNGEKIALDSVNRTVAGLNARDRRSISDAQDRVLSRMIDEELLVQQALDSGAAETDPEVRASLVRAAISRVNAEAAAQPITERELGGYYQAHRSAYATPARFEIMPFYFESKTFPNLEDAQRRARAAQAALRAGRSVAEVQRYADALPFVIPPQLMTAGTVTNYFGPMSVNLLQSTRTGELTATMELDRGVLFLCVNRRVGGDIPSLAAIRELLRGDAMRDRQERALENLLAALRKTARIERSPLPPLVVSR